MMPYVIPSTLNEQQEQAVRQGTGPLAIAAGAGSGKTFTLTQRLAYALASDGSDTPQGTDELLAITFTNKAAEELVSRVRRELRAAGMGKEALGIDGAWISTIHGMCSRMLRAHALDIGLDPAFEVLEEAQADLLKQDAYRQMLEEARTNSRYAELLAVHKTQALYDIIQTLQEQIAVLPEGAAALCAGPEACDAEEIIGWLEPRLRETLVVYRGFGNSPLAQNAGDKIAALISELREVRKSEDGLEPLRDILEAYAGAAKTGKGATSEVKAAIDDERALITEARMRLASSSMFGQTKLFIELAQAMQELYLGSKERLAALDNDDLLLFTYRLLKKHPNIAASYRQQFKMVMVDEFQDTSQLQIDIIKLLCGEAQETLCTVGDEQQSIYAFRGADVEVYRQHKDELCAAGFPALEFTQNYRSHPDILTAVNTLFGQPEAFGDGLLALAPGRDEARVEPCLPAGFPRLDILMCEGDGGGSGDIRAFEARYIARRFAQLCEAGMKPGDMTILLRATTHIDAYAEAVRAEGLPCVASGGSAFFAYDEVNIMARFLKVLANPNDDEALLVVLASPLFGLSDDDLLALQQQRRYFGPHKYESYYQVLARQTEKDAIPASSLTAEAGVPSLGSSPAAMEDAAARPTLVRAAVQLQRSLELAKTVPLAHVLWGALEDSPWDGQLLAGGVDGSTTYANIVKFIDKVAQAQHMPQASLIDIAQRFEDACLTSSERDKAGILIGDDVDAVHILTIHAAKGLEFPVVALGGFFCVNRPEGDALVSARWGNTVHVGMRPRGDWFANEADSTNIIDAAKNYLKAYKQGPEELLHSMDVHADEGSQPEHLGSLVLKTRRVEAEEANRLLYVALTRAKEALIIGATNHYHGVDYRKKASTLGILAKAFFEGVFPDGRSARFALDGSGVCEDGKGRYMHFAFEKDEAGVRHPLLDEAEQGEWGDLESRGEAMQVLAAESFEFGPLVLEPNSVFVRRQFSYSALAKALGHAVSEDDADMPGSDALGAAGAAGSRVAVRAAVTASVTCSSCATQPDPKDAPETREQELAHAGILSNGEDEEGQLVVPANIFGSAFHTLAQALAQTREREALPQKGVDALCARYGFGDALKLRLVDAASAWMGCEIAARAFAFDIVRPEMPFNLKIEEDFYLEGSIDLFCRDAAVCAADAAASQNDTDPAVAAAATSKPLPSGLIVDYKTGASLGEEDEGGLEGRYRLQATCYAYAALNAGLGNVDVVFVRPEVLREGQVQTVEYRFVVDDVPAMREVILQAHEQYRSLT